MIRRTSWRHYRHDHAEVAARAARWMADELGWDDATLETELRNYRERIGTNGAPPPHITTNGDSHTQTVVNAQTPETRQFVQG
jgi:hypothetical protein